MPHEFEKKPKNRLVGKRPGRSERGEKFRLAFIEQRENTARKKPKRSI